MEVAHPQRGSSLEMLVFEEGENRSTRRKTSRSKGENQQQTQPTYGVDAGIWIYKMYDKNVPLYKRMLL